MYVIIIIIIITIIILSQFAICQHICQLAIRVLSFYLHSFRRVWKISKTDC